jgi:hypothetical protein
VNQSPNPQPSEPTRIADLPRTKNLPRSNTGHLNSSDVENLEAKWLARESWLEGVIQNDNRIINALTNDLAWANADRDGWKSKCESAVADRQMLYEDRDTWKQRAEAAEAACAAANHVTARDMLDAIAAVQKAAKESPCRP